MEKGSNQSESLCEGIDLSSRSLALPASGNDLHYTGCTPTGAEGWRDFTLEISPIKLQDWVIKWLGQKPPQNSVLSPSKDLKYESCIDCDVVVRIINSPSLYLCCSSVESSVRSTRSPTREQAEVSGASAEHSSRPTPFVSDRLTQGCVCACACTQLR